MPTGASEASERTGGVDGVAEILRLPVVLLRPLLRTDLVELWFRTLE